MKHLCPDWDYLEIDENDPEYECCTCVKKVSKSLYITKVDVTNKVVTFSEIPPKSMPKKDIGDAVNFITGDTFHLLPNGYLKKIKRRNNT